MLKIVPTTDNIGYWITVGGHSDYNENIQLGLESVSEHFIDRITHLREEIRKLEVLKAETDKELESRGGKYRPRRVSVPASDIWYSKCSVCKESNHKINSVAIEVTVGSVKILCHKCGKDKFPALVR